MSTTQELEYKTCRSCEQIMPVSEFDKRARTKDGYAHICKHCFKLKDKAVKAHVKRTCAAVDRMQLGLIRKLAAEPQQEFTDIPDVGTAVQHLLRPFGGIEGLSLQTASSYLMCEPDSANRYRYAKLIVDMVKEASKLGYAKKPLDLMGDDELEAFADELLRRTVDGKQAKDIPELAEGA